VSTSNWKGNAVIRPRPWTITVLLWSLATLPTWADEKTTVPASRVTPASGVAPVDAFWSSLRQLCGKAFAGKLVESVPPDTSFAGKALVMHVRECSDTTIRIPFHVGDNRSRTWVLTRNGNGLRLKHDHRHEDGSEDAVTQYGGDTADEGSATQQEFPADAYTGKLLPISATNIWTIEVEPGRLYAYALRREGRRFRVEFDLTTPIDPPPAPWGF
jgi:hypothetical protein